MCSSREHLHSTLSLADLLPVSYNKQDKYTAFEINRMPYDQNDIISPVHNIR